MRLDRPPTGRAVVHLPSDAARIEETGEWTLVWRARLPCPSHPQALKCGVRWDRNRVVDRLLDWAGEARLRGRERRANDLIRFAWAVYEL